MCKESIFRKRECHYAVFSYFIKVSRKYEFHNKIGLYFVSFATVCWIDVFTRHEYFDILASSIKYCREHKGMELCCYCFMPSHCHFLRSAKEQPMELLRNYKKFTSKKVIETIENNPQESRKNGYFICINVQGKIKVTLIPTYFGNITTRLLNYEATS